MKPKNFPARKLRRQQRAKGTFRNFPKDIKLRLGSSGWQQVIREQTS